MQYKLDPNYSTKALSVVTARSWTRTDDPLGPGTFQSESEKCKFKRELNSSMSIARTGINARSSFLSRNLNSKERETS